MGMTTDKLLVFTLVLTRISGLMMATPVMGAQQAPMTVRALISFALAVLISVAVGVGLDLLSTTLPQAQQEMMETVINAIAVVFVTSMIIWMNRNAPRLKGELEREARQALNHGGALALVAMAFLAVLKMGTEGE